MYSLPRETAQRPLCDLQERGNYLQGRGIFRIEAKALGNMASLEVQQKQFSDGLKALKQARDIFRQVGDSLGESNEALTLGSIYVEQKAFDDAEHEFASALDLSKQNGDKLRQALALNGLADV